VLSTARQRRARPGHRATAQAVATTTRLSDTHTHLQRVQRTSRARIKRDAGGGDKKSNRATLSTPSALICSTTGAKLVLPTPSPQGPRASAATAANAQCQAWAPTVCMLLVLRATDVPLHLGRRVDGERSVGCFGEEPVGLARPHAARTPWAHVHGDQDGDDDPDGGGRGGQVPHRYAAVPTPWRWA
jgi:hypothetical protein